MTDPMTDPHAIAKSLSEAQRDVFRDNQDEDTCWFRDERSVYGFRKRGFIADHLRGDTYAWTSLGKSVRAALLEGTENDGS